MNCPKGHAGAECVIGNFWKCPVCDRTPAATQQKNPTTLLEIIAHAVAVMWPDRKVADFASRWPGIPRVTGQFWGVDTNTQTAWWACELGGIDIARHRHNARAFTDYIGSTISVFLSSVVLPDLAQRTIPCRGGRGVESLGATEFPHWVADDGQILVRCMADGVLFAGFELRMRAIWKPAQP